MAFGSKLLLLYGMECKVCIIAAIIYNDYLYKRYTVTVDDGQTSG